MSEVNKHDLNKVFNNLDMFFQMLESNQLSQEEIVAFIQDIKGSIEKAKEIIDAI